MKMTKMDVLRRFTKWLSSWFINRNARLRENGSIGPSITFMEGLRQGAFLLPLLITIYKNNLLTEFQKDTIVSANSDDLLIASSGRNKDMIVASLQSEVDKVVAWSDKAR